MTRISASNRLSVVDHPGVLRAMRVVAGFRTQINPWIRKTSLLFFLCAVVMIASLLLGGGTRGGFLSDTILQLLAIPLLLVSLWRMFEARLTKQMQLAVWFCLVIALLPLIQLVPLPPWLWTLLPGRAPSAEAFEILGKPTPWMPISMSPQATWLSMLSIFPPAAIFLGTLLLAYQERRRLSLVVIALGIISLFVGLLQIAQGPQSPLRFFQFTNTTEAVGFFANRNHFAALLYCLILFVAAWTMHAAIAVRVEHGPGRHEYNLTAIVTTIAGFTVLVALLSGEAMARSRAGLGLTIFALFGALALGYANRHAVGISVHHHLRRFSPNKVLLVAIVLAGTFIIQFALFRVEERFAYDPVEDARHVFVRHTVEAAKAYMPLGSGMGTFVPVYAMFEKPDEVSAAYVNHAHNDILELWLEAGAIGLVLMTLFVLWLTWRSVEIWRKPPAFEADALDKSLACASTIVVALILAHSVVDYPLRTGAMMAIMAFACALLVESPTRYGHTTKVLPTTQVKTRQVRHVPTSVTTASPPLPSAEPLEAASGSSVERWGADMEWPEEWSKSSSPSSSNESRQLPPIKNHD
jgi:hypothetical protein